MRHNPAPKTPPPQTEKLIHHIIALWDECDHVSAKRSAALAELFWAGYVHAFPQGRETAESPAVMVTSSPMFDLARVRSFFHDGAMIPYSGKNKDLAIAKFCTSGFIDQDEKYHFVIDDMRTLRGRQGDPLMYSDEHVLVAFITSDTASGMNQAINYVMSHQKSKRSNFVCLQTAKHLAKGDPRMMNAGYLLGTEFGRRFIRIQDRGLVLKLEI